MKRILRLIQWFTFLSLLFHYPRRRTPTREESTMMNVSLRAFTFDTSRLLRICPTFAKCLVPPPKPSPGIKRSDAYQGRRSTKIYNYAPDVPRERSHLNCVWSVGRFVATFDAEFNQRGETEGWRWLFILTISNINIIIIVAVILSGRWWPPKRNASVQQPSATSILFLCRTNDSHAHSHWNDH